MSQAQKFGVVCSGAALSIRFKAVGQDCLVPGCSWGLAGSSCGSHCMVAAYGMLAVLQLGAI